MENNIFSTLYSINVNDHTEQRDNLTYLSWAWAWAEVKKQYPDATYTVEKFNGLPYVFDPMTGYMVYTTVTIDNITHEMWLPVMDSANHAMKAEPYDVSTRYKTVTVKPATMFDVNKTIMRCLTKNLAMFGLGLYIYAGEDLPESEREEVTIDRGTPEEEIAKLQAILLELAKGDIERLEKWSIAKFGKSSTELTLVELREAKVALAKQVK